MQIKEIYRNRFDDRKVRVGIWKILVNHYFAVFFKSSDTVLDIGSGYCEFINEIKCAKKYALDINPDIKKYAEKNVTTLISSSTKIPLKNNSIDKIFVSNFFEHITREEIIQTIKECKRLLKSGGEIITMHPNIRFLQKDYWSFFDHITPIDDRAMEEIFLANDLYLEKRVLRFLPYSIRRGIKYPDFIVKLYISIPLLWFFLGKQSLLVFTKNINKS